MPDLVWIRLHDGRLWHLTGTDHAGRPVTSLCGKRVDQAAARAPEMTSVPPTNGWVCDRCVRHLHDQAANARAVWLQDPRRRPGDQLPGPEPDSPPAPDVAPTSTVPGQEAEH